MPRQAIVNSPEPARWALAGLALSALLPSLGTSIANVALPTIAQAYGASFQAVQWVVLSYLVAVTASVAGIGRAGDLIGRRRLLLTGILLFTAASILCGLAPTLWLLVGARAVQGVGAAAMMALAMSLVGEAVPKARMATALGLLAAMSAIGTALGPPLGGLLIAGAGWRAIFLVALPLGLAAFLLLHRHLPRDRRAETDRAGFDTTGSVLLAVTLAAYALAMTLGGAGFGTLNVALLAAAVLAGGLFALAEAKAPAPLIRLAFLREAGLGARLAMNALVSTVMMATLVVGPFHLARGLGLEPFEVGLVMSAGPLVAALAGVPAGRLADRFSDRGIVRAGLVGMGVGTSLLAVLPAALGIAGYLGPIVLVTAAYALFQTANSAAVLTGLDSDRRGAASGLLNLSRNLGLVSGASLLGAVFAAGSAGADVANAPPDAVAAGMRTTFAVATALILAALALARPLRCQLRSRPRPAPGLF